MSAPLLCAACRQDIQSNWKVCPYCGKSLASQGLHNENRFKCVQCERHYHKQDRYDNYPICWQCASDSGLSLREAEKAREEAEKEIARIQKIKEEAEAKAVEAKRHKEATEQELIAAKREKDKALQQAEVEKHAREKAEAKLRQEQQVRLKTEEKIKKEQQHQKELRKEKEKLLPPKGSGITSCLLYELEKADGISFSIPVKIKFFIEDQPQMSLVSPGKGTVIVYSKKKSAYLFDIVPYLRDKEIGLYGKPLESHEGAAYHRYSNHNNYYLATSTPLARTTSNGDIVMAAIFYDISPGTYIFGAGTCYHSLDNGRLNVVPNRVHEVSV